MGVMSILALRDAADGRVAGFAGRWLVTGARSAGAIDPFRGRQVPGVAGRFLRERDRHQRQSDLMWTGTLVAMFSDHELGLLDDLGFLSERDRQHLRQAGRGVKR
jgi:hypothetical protein